MNHIKILAWNIGSGGGKRLPRIKPILSLLSKELRPDYILINENTSGGSPATSRHSLFSAGGMMSGYTLYPGAHAGSAKQQAVLHKTSLGSLTTHSRCTLAKGTPGYPPNFDPGALTMLRISDSHRDWDLHLVHVESTRQFSDSIRAWLQEFSSPTSNRPFLAIGDWNNGQAYADWLTACGGYNSALGLHLAHSARLGAAEIMTWELKGTAGGPPLSLADQTFGSPRPLATYVAFSTPPPAVAPLSWNDFFVSNIDGIMCRQIHFKYDVTPADSVAFRLPDGRELIPSDHLPVFFDVYIPDNPRASVPGPGCCSTF